MRKPRIHHALSIAVVAAALAALGCGSSGATPGDGGAHDATSDGVSTTSGDGSSSSETGAGDDTGGGGDAGASCLRLGGACTQASECCSGSCVGDVCVFPSCTSDNKACTTNLECCSGTCGAAHTCTPLNTTCSTTGNACTQSSACCSKDCAHGVCTPSSFCRSEEHTSELQS